MATEQNLGLRHDDLKPAFDASVDQTDARYRRVPTEKQPTANQCVGLLLSSAGDRTPLELFIAGVQGCVAGLLARTASGTRTHCSLDLCQRGHQILVEGQSLSPVRGGVRLYLRFWSTVGCRRMLIVAASLSQEEVDFWGYPLLRI
jgi:hypothetical protein